MGHSLLYCHVVTLGKTPERCIDRRKEIWYRCCNGKPSFSLLDYVQYTLETQTYPFLGDIHKVQGCRRGVIQRAYGVAVRL